MFSRKTCYFFVRPKQKYLELCIFLGRKIEAREIRRVDRASKSKLYHLIRITHRDEVEPPITDWLKEAYELLDQPAKPRATKTTADIPRKAGQVSKRVQQKQLARLRRICASIPGAIEKLSHGEPTFFTPKRVFAMFAGNHHNDGHVAVWLPAAPGVQADRIREVPGTYFRPPYVGASGWVAVELSKVDDEQLEALIREAFQFINAKSAGRHDVFRTQRASRESGAPLRKKR
jgi:hypothetical protein